MKKWAVLAGLLLSGCASAGQLRGGRADIDSMTDKPAERVAGCIGDAFEKFNVGFIGMQGISFSTRPTAAGLSISGVQAGLMGSDTVILVDIAKADGRIRVMMFDHFLGSGGGKWADFVRGCL